MDSVSREEIFSKDYLTIKDIEVLLGTTYQVAARLIRQIKFKTDRLGLQGKIHIEDYFEYYHITDRQGYFKQKEKTRDDEIESDGYWVVIHDRLKKIKGEAGNGSKRFRSNVAGTQSREVGVPERGNV